MSSLISQLEGQNLTKKSVVFAKSSKYIFNSFSERLSNILRVLPRELYFRDYVCRIFYVETDSFYIYCFLMDIQNSIIELTTKTSCLLIILITYNYFLFFNPKCVKDLVKSVLKEVFENFEYIEFAYNLSPEIFFDRLENLLFKDKSRRDKLRTLIITYLLYPLKVYYYITLIEYVVSCFRDVISSSLIKSKDLSLFLEKFSDYTSTVLRMRVSKIIAIFSAYVSFLVFFFRILLIWPNASKCLFLCILLALFLLLILL